MTAYVCDDTITGLPPYTTLPDSPAGTAPKGLSERGSYRTDRPYALLTGHA
ncbi:hypothetical protein GCM10009696_00830 [Kocuria himachalensis]